MNSFYESHNVLTEAQCHLFHHHPPSFYKVYIQQRREVNLQELKKIHFYHHFIHHIGFQSRILHLLKFI